MDWDVFLTGLVMYGLCTAISYVIVELLLDRERTMKKYVVRAVLILIPLLLIIGLYLGYEAAHADGRVQYCYIKYVSPEGMPPVYQVYGHVEWRHDHLMATKNTHEEALWAAEQLRCPLGHGDMPAMPAAPASTQPPQHTGPMAVPRH